MDTGEIQCENPEWVWTLEKPSVRTPKSVDTYVKSDISNANEGIISDRGIPRSD